MMAASGEVGKGTVAALLAQGVDSSSIVAAGRNPESLNDFECGRLSSSATPITGIKPV